MAPEFSPLPRPSGALGALALLAAALGPGLAAAGDQTVLHVQFKVVDGRFAADPDPARTTLTPSDSFAKDYRLSQDQARAQLIATLNARLATTDKIATLDGAICAPASPENQAVCDVRDASWDDASALFATWVQQHKPEYEIPALYMAAQLFEAEFLGQTTGDPKFQPLLTPTALTLVVPDPPDGGFDVGQADFVVRPPIQARQIRTCDDPGGDCIIALSKNADAFHGHVSRRAMARSLAPLAGQVWDLERIHRELGDLLDTAGFPTTAPGAAAQVQDTTLASAGAGANVAIDGPPPVSTFQFVFSSTQDCGVERDAPGERAAMMKALYLLLPEAAFRQVRAHPTWIACTNGTLGSTNAVRFRLLRVSDAQGAIPRSYANQLYGRLPALTALGFNASLVDDTAGGAARVQIVRVSDAKPGAAAPSGQPADAVADPPSAATPTPAPPTPPARTTAVQGEPRHSLRIGGGAQSHRPAEAFVEYAQRDLTGDDAVLLHAGVRDKPIIKGSYDKDFVGFGGLGRRLTVSLQGGSDFTPDIPDGAARADERRSGGSVSAELQLFRDLDRQALGLSGSFGYEAVSLDTPAGAPAQFTEHISHVTFGASYAWIGSDTLNVPDVTLEPSVTAAWGDGATPSHQKASLRGVVHDRFESFFEYDARVGLDWASRRTPASEAPRLGGDESLRGLRSEAASGRFVWSVQNEVWFPLRFTERLGPGLDGVLRNHLKLAAFVDMGGATDNLQGLPSFNAGAGLGLRYKLQENATVRLDWAHLLTRTPPGMASQAVYLSIVLLPFRD